MAVMTTNLEAMIARSIRMRMVLGMIPGAEEHRADLDVWLAGAGTAVAEIEDAAIALTAPPDLGRATLQLMVPRYAGAWIGSELDGASVVELDRFSAFCRELPERRVGHWIGCAGPRLERGWVIAGPIALERIAPLVIADSRRSAFVSACRDRRLDNVVRVSRLLGGYTELRVALPTDCEAALAAAREVFLRVELPLPPRFDELFAATTPKMLAARIGERGVVRLSVLAVPHDLRAVVAFCVATRVPDPMALAEVEGVLGVDGPDVVEYFARSSGSGVELHYG